MNITTRINLLVSEINGVFHDVSIAMGLSDSASIILYTLSSYGSCLLSDIVRLSGVSKQTINSALRKLEAEGIVTVIPEDHRRKRVSLTPQGKALAENTVEKMIAVENALFDSWPEEDRDAYVRLTQRYLDQIREGFQKII